MNKIGFPVRISTESVIKAILSTQVQKFDLLYIKF
jgi:hypothetical protein